MQNNAVHWHWRLWTKKCVCGQTAGRMKTPLGMEVDLSPGHIVLGTQQPPAKGAQQPSPSFWPMSFVAMVAHLTYC